MSAIRVDIDSKKNRISVWNNGKGIPVQIHKEHKIYVPEMIFGHLLTSSNYDDREKKVTGGRNGFGAKLTNIYSTEFVIECADSSARKLYRQVFSSNMTQRGEPQIVPYQNGSDYTKVEFAPDLPRFGLTALADDDTLALFTKRVYDTAGVTSGSVGVWLNGKKLPVRNF